MREVTLMELVDALPLDHQARREYDSLRVRLHQLEMFHSRIGGAVNILQRQELTGSRGIGIGIGLGGAMPDPRMGSANGFSNLEPPTSAPPGEPLFPEGREFPMAQQARSADAESRGIDKR